MARDPEPGWIGGRAFDLAFFFGGSALAALTGVALLVHPAWTVPVWWLFTLLADGPHLIITALRTYVDPRDRARLGRALWLVPLWTLLGPLALLAARLTGSSIPWDLFLLLATGWGYYHVIRQHYGVLSIYERHDGAGRTFARLDGWFLQGSLWTMFAVYLLVVPVNRRVMELPLVPGPRERLLVLAIAGVTGAAVLAWLGVQLVRARRGDRLRAAGFALGPVVALSAFNLFVVGAREPLLPRPPNAEQCFLAVTIVGGLVHSIQYVGISLATNRRRYATRPDTGLAARLGRAPLRAYLAVLAVSVIAYGLLNGARGSPGLAFFGLESDAARLFLGVYWGLFFAHYHLDQLIWHPSKDPSLRSDLGLPA
jgi:hypothetical protein